MALIVNDFEKSVAWYQEVFEMQLVDKIINEERGFKQANLVRSNFKVEIIEIRNISTPTERVGGFFKFGLSVDRFDEWVDRLKSLAVEFNGGVVQDPVSGKSMIILKDPDGNRIQLFES